MCYNTSIPDSSKLKKSYSKHKLKEEKELPALFHVSGFVHPTTPVITAESPDCIDLLQWGLIPKWVKSETQAKDLRKQTLNAKSETIFEKPSFRSSINKKRCLVLVEGFYEWRDVGGKKYPYFIHLKDAEVFALGGIYESWTSQETGEIFNTYSIVTTEANPLMAMIHNLKLRMPLIIGKENESDWLNVDLPKESIQGLMKPFNQDLMNAYTISRLITSRTENSNVVEVRSEFVYSEL
jgi:putative SOS response-associated peptidase YedK